MSELHSALDTIARAHSFTSERQLARHLKISHTHLREIREGLRGPSADLLTEILEQAKRPTDLPVLQLIRDQQKGKARRVIDRAIKALTAASLAVPFLMVGTSDQKANAATDSVPFLSIMRQIEQAGTKPRLWSLEPRSLWGNQKTSQCTPCSLRILES